MCFSAPASFTAATALSLIGIATLHKITNKRMIPFAVSPLFFAAQQALEGTVWLTISNSAAHGFLHTLGVYGFHVFAALFWPIWIPGSLWYIEKNPTRKKILKGLIVVGTVVSAVSLVSMCTLGIVATAHHHHITYDFARVPFSPLTMQYVSVIGWSLYVIAVIGAFFTSSITLAWLLGLLVALAFVVAQLFYQYSFGSVWCFFAAVISMLTYYIVTKEQQKIS